MSATAKPLEDKWIVIPVAVPGTGRSRIARVLEHLFGFARLERPVALIDGSGNLTGPGKTYLSHLAAALGEHRVVIVDGNNHLAEDRRALQAVTGNVGTTPRARARLLALSWDVCSMSMAAAYALCASRVDVSDARACGSLWRSISEFEPVHPTETHGCIALPLDEDIATTLWRVVTGIASILHLECPGEAQLALALAMVPSTPATSTLTATHDSPMASDTSDSRDVPQALLPVSVLQTIPHYSALEREDGSCYAKQASASQSLIAHDATMVPLSAAERNGLPDPRDTDAAQTSALIKALSDQAAQDESFVTFRCFRTPSKHVITRWAIRKPAFDALSLAAPPIFAESIWMQENVIEDMARDQGQVGAMSSHKILLRPYDHLYSIDEAPWTTWPSFFDYMIGPIFVSAKLDGFSIMIAALTPEELIVSSKNAVAPQAGRVALHAQKAEHWLLHQLQRIGKSPTELAACLWQNNWTLMCQLLDNDLEERVLPVPEGQAGLYLHGMNRRSILFHPEDPGLVASFAGDWGFREVPYETLDSVSQLEYLILNCQYECGRWNGVVVAGLVVRATVGAGGSEAATSGVCYPPPHPVGSPIFFKYPFDEPFGLWRTYRELTRTAIAGQNPNPDAGLTPKILSRYETIAYHFWVTERLRSDAQLRASLARGRGFFALRDEFIVWSQTDEASERVSDAHARVVATSDGKPLSNRLSDTKWVIMFVGLPGCGKTTLFEVLSMLFGIRRIQFDHALPPKQARARFFAGISRDCKMHQIVMVDASCHRAARRAKLRKAAKQRTQMKLNVLAFNWCLPRGIHAMAQRLCSARLEKCHSLTTTAADRIVQHALAEFDPLEQSEAEHVVRMHYDEDLSISLLRAVEVVSRLLRIRPPTRDAILEAAGRVTKMLITPRGPRLSSLGPSVPGELRHFALLPEIDGRAVLTTLLDNRQFLESRFSAHWRRAFPRDCILDVRPRVTVTHPAMSLLSADEEAALINRCAALPSTVLVRLSLREVFFDQRIVAARAHLTPSNDNLDALRFAQSLPDAIRANLHVVLARESSFVHPHEAAALLGALRRGDPNIDVVQLDEEICTVARLRGMAR